MGSIFDIIMNYGFADDSRPFFDKNCFVVSLELLILEPSNCEVDKRLDSTEFPLPCGASTTHVHHWNLNLNAYFIKVWWKIGDKDVDYRVWDINYSKGSLSLVQMPLFHGGNIYFLPMHM
jgi:hypothetical protein